MPDARRRPIRLALRPELPRIDPDRLGRFIPEAELVPLRRIDERLPTLDDRALVIALHQLGYQGLVTNNYKMLKNPKELAAIIRGESPSSRSKESATIRFGPPAPSFRSAGSAQAVRHPQVASLLAATSEPCTRRSDGSSGSLSRTPAPHAGRPAGRGRGVERGAPLASPRLNSDPLV